MVNIVVAAQWIDQKKDELYDKIMGLADALNIGRTTKRYLTNILILVALFAILYWDSSGKDDDFGEFDLKRSRKIQEKADLRFDKKWDVEKDSNDILPGKLQQTTPAPVDHTEGETEGLGVFSFFGHLWNGQSRRGQFDRPPPDPHQEEPHAYSMRITNDQINKFKMDLPPLLPNYKNPCWIEELPVSFSYEKSFFSECIISRKRQISKHAHKFKAFETYLQNRTTSTGQKWRIRCFPYFFLLGVGKSGTTDYFDTLKDYVSDFVPGFLKELHYWEWKRCHERELCQSIDPRHPTFADYLDTYDAASEVIRRTIVKKPDGTAYHPLVIGDFTPSTLTFHPCWDRLPGNEHLHEPRYTTAHYIYSIRPQSKFIFILRDPVERVYSNYRMQSRLSHSPQDDADTFHKDVSKVIHDLEKCFKEQTHRACAYKDMKFDTYTHVTNSMYEIFIRDWLLLFPRDQFLVIKMEDYNKSRVPFVKKTISFLGLTPLTPEQEWQVDNKQITNIGNADKSKHEMRDDTRRLLRNFFRPWNQRLAKLLKDDRFTWDY